MKVVKDTSKLHPEFIPIYNMVWGEIMRHDLPLEVFETLRTPERQTYLFEQKRSKLKGKQGAHTHGMAVDFILDMKRLKGAQVNPWDTGVSDQGKIVNPDVLAVWLFFGRVLHTQFPKIRWGGDWRKGKKVALGWDPYHIELENWTNRILG